MVSTGGSQETNDVGPVSRQADERAAEADGPDPDGPQAVDA